MTYYYYKITGDNKPEEPEEQSDSGTTPLPVGLGTIEFVYQHGIVWASDANAAGIAINTKYGSLVSFTLHEFKLHPHNKVTELP